jgi:hypothetical protein
LEKIAITPGRASAQPLECNLTKNPMITQKINYGAL